MVERVEQTVLHIGTVVAVVALAPLVITPVKHRQEKAAMVFKQVFLGQLHIMRGAEQAVELDQPVDSVVAGQHQVRSEVVVVQEPKTRGAEVAAEVVTAGLVHRVVQVS
jgi:hypothetical protein